MGRPPRLWEYRGAWLTTTQLAELAGLPRDVVDTRLHHGYTVERAVTEPHTPYRRTVVYRGRAYTGVQLAALVGTSGNLLSALHKCWYEMVYRCTNPEHRSFKYYGGRGIQVCARWAGPDGAANFEADLLEGFVDHCLTHGLVETTLDRIDVDGDYCPENCRWATRAEQVRNRRCTVTMEHHGRRAPLGELVRAAGLDDADYDAVHHRIFRRGMSVDAALAQGPAVHRHTLTVDGVEDTLAGHCRRLGLDYGFVQQRIARYGDDFEAARHRAHPARRPRLRTVTFEGRVWTVGELAARVGVSTRRLCARIARVGVERAVAMGPGDCRLRENRREGMDHAEEEEVQEAAGADDLGGPEGAGGAEDGREGPPGGR